MNKLLATIAGVALTVLPAAAFATTTTGNVSVTATVNPACTLSTPSALAFGNYDPSNPLAQPGSSGNESITCTNTTNWALSTPATDVLSGPGGATLNASSIAPSPLSGTGSGSAQNFTVSGSIAPGQYSTPGAYTGTVVVTATF